METMGGIKVRNNDPPQKLYLWDLSPKSNVSWDFNNRDKKRGIKIFILGVIF